MEEDSTGDQSKKMSGKDRCCVKSPVNIQEWVDSISIHKSEDEFQGRVITCLDGKLEVDTLHLGAEAAAQSKEIVNKFRLQERRASLLQMKEKTSLQSDISSQSASSSIETLLESRRENPEEILLNLGFGGSVGPLDPLARIPKRFLQPSQVKGNDLDQFVRHQEELLEALDSGFCGYRGLSGFVNENQRPLGIVGKILNKIRADRSSTTSPTCGLTSFSEVAFSVMAANTFRNILLRNSQQQESILEPANRQFLDHQGENEKNERRLILGQDTYSVDGDGSLVHSGKIHKPVLSRRRTASLVLDNEEENKESEETKPKLGLWDVCRMATAKQDESSPSPEFNLSTRRCSTDRLLVRQNSICLDTNESLFPDDVISATNDETCKQMCTLPISNDEKLSTYKESFELEELPSHAEGEDGIDDEAQEGERLQSALSDSSGFLDGETCEVLQADETRKNMQSRDDQSSENPSTLPRLVRPEPVRPGVEISDVKESDEREREDLVAKNIFRPINEHTNLPQIKFEFDDDDEKNSSLSSQSVDETKSVEIEEKKLRPPSEFLYKTEFHLEINPNETMPTILIDGSPMNESSDSNEVSQILKLNSPNVNTFQNEMREIPSGVSILSRTAQVTQQEEVNEGSSGTRRHSLVTTTIKTQELVVTPQMSPQVSPRVSPSTTLEEDEYYDLQRLLAIISGGKIKPKLSRQEFFSKPVKERARVEAIALQMALQKYEQTLHTEQSTLNRYKDSCDAEQKEELILLRQLHAGICNEVAQLQSLLKWRIQNINKSKLLPLSIRLIRQFSLLLHQQNYLCQQLERLKVHEMTCENSVDKFQVSDDENPSDEIQTRMQFILQSFQDRLLTELHQTVHEENSILRRELEHNRTELSEIKCLLKSLISQQKSEGCRTLKDEPHTS